MSNIYELSNEYQELLDEIAESKDLTRFIAFKGLGIEKQKLPVVVQKANATLEYLINTPDTVCVYINERIMDALDNNQKRLLIEDALSTVSFDSEKDKIIITKPEITVTLWGRRKYGSDLLDALEAAVLYQQQLAEQEAKEKEEKRQERLEKKKEHL